MNHEQFCYYLSGILSKSKEVSQVDIDNIRKKLKRVLYSPIIKIENQGMEPYDGCVDESPIIGFKQNGK